MIANINGKWFYTGDYVIGVIPHCIHNEETGEDMDLEEEVFGRIYIKGYNPGSSKNSIKFYVCQNRADGDRCEEENRFGYDYSWVADVDDEGNITTSDLYSLRHATIEEIAKNWSFEKATKDIKELVQGENDDDDPMPSDWTTDEKLPF